MSETNTVTRPPVTPMSAREADRRAARSNAQEGLHLTEPLRKLREKVLNGEMTEEQFRDHITNHYKVD